VSLDVALEHHERGLALLPLRAQGKEPNFRVLQEVHGSPEWTPLACRRASSAEVRAWQEVDAAVNVGVILGQASGGLVVADFDRAPKGVTHPPTPIVRTGRGHHVYLHSDGRVNTQGFVWGELRGDGSYVVLPDSVHPKGTRYSYVVSPDEVAVANLADLRFADTRTAPISEEPNRQGDIGTPYVMPEYPSEGAFYDLARHEEPVRAACKTLGINARIGASFRCILPGHLDRRPSASIYRDPLTGLYLYRDWHAQDQSEWLPLSWVRAARGYGEVRSLKGPESSRWYLRLFYEAGVLLPMRVELPPLPAGIVPSFRKVAEGFRLLLGLRWLREPGTPAPFTRRFVAAWSEVGERAAGEAICGLVALGIIEKVDEHRGAGVRTTNLYLPGTGHPTPNQRSAL
jgi:hypothetical protein